MQTFEYSLQLGTGESLDVAEIVMATLDDWSRKAFEDPAAAKAMHKVTSLCSRIPHRIMEYAKIGYTKPLERLLKTPPIGALMKLDKPECLNLSDCAMADQHKCTTRFLLASAKFPECWDYTLIGKDEEFTDGMVAAQEIVKTIVMAWRDGRHVIISE